MPFECSNFSLISQRNSPYQYVILSNYCTFCVQAFYDVCFLKRSHVKLILIINCFK